MNIKIRHPETASAPHRRPCAAAYITGDDNHPNLKGYVRFYQNTHGVIVTAEIHGLPGCDGVCRNPVFGFHIHEGTACSGNVNDMFADAGMHYNPHDCAHPYHSGDMPPLFGADGYAFMSFLTNRFTVDEIIGKTVIIHSSPDDFTTQPSGNAGTKIACGTIKKSGKSICNML